MNCRACGADLERAFHLPLCDACLRARTEVEEIPGLHRIERRYRVFKVVAPVTALAYYAGVYMLGVKDPLALVGVCVSWLTHTLLLSGAIEMVWARPRI